MAGLISNPTHKHVGTLDGTREVLPGVFLTEEQIRKTQMYRESLAAAAKTKLDAEKKKRKGARAEKKAERCNPESENYDPEYAAKVAIREANKESKEPIGKSLEKIKELISKAGAKISHERVKKAGIRAIVAEDKIVGFRAFLTIKMEDGSEMSPKAVFTQHNHPELDLVQLKDMAEAYVERNLKAA